MFGKTEYIIKFGKVVCRGRIVNHIGRKLVYSFDKYDITSKLPIDILKKVS